MPVCSSSLPGVKLGVQEEKQQVDVDLGLPKNVHDRHALILELQEVLDVNVHVLKSDAHKLGVDLEHSVRRRRLKWKNKGINNVQVHSRQIRWFDVKLHTCWSDFEGEGG